MDAKKFTLLDCIVGIDYIYRNHDEILDDDEIRMLKKILYNLNRIYDTWCEL